MTTGQTIETKIVVDAKQGIAELAKFDQETKAAEKALRDADAATKAFEKSQREAVAAVTAIDTRIAKYERDMMALGAALLSGKGNTAAYEQELRQLGRELDALNGRTDPAIKKTRDFAKAAADVQVQGRGSGLAVLEASRAFEDLQYGIGGVLNNIPGLLMNLGIGAGLTGVVSVAAVGINMLAKNFGNVDPAAKEATDAAREHVKSLRDEISGLGRDLRALQVGAERAAMEQQAGALMEAQRGFEQAVAPIGGAERFRRLRDNEKLVGTLADQMKVAMEAANRLDLEIQKTAGMRRIEQEKEDQRKIDAAIDLANEQERIEQERTKKATENHEKESKARFDIFVAELKEEEDQIKESNKSRQNSEQERLDLQYKMREAELKGEEDELRQVNKARKEAAEEEKKQAEKIAKEKADAIKAIEQKQNDFLVGLGQSAATQLLSTGQAYIEAKIKGEKDAEKKAVASFLSATGQQLVASGTRAIFEGAIISANPLTPGAGLPMIGMGAAAIAVGVGMGAGGTAMAPPAEAKNGGGAARDRGASPRSSRGGGDGGPLVINVSYGVGGPLPEDTAREIAKVMRTGNRRRGAA